MINTPASVGYQQLAPQPAALVDPPVRQESVQPRRAPAADSQRGDQKSLASKDEAPPHKGRSDKGKVDISV